MVSAPFQFAPDEGMPASLPAGYGSGQQRPDGDFAVQRQSVVGIDTSDAAAGDLTQHPVAGLAGRSPPGASGSEGD